MTRRLLLVVGAALALAPAASAHVTVEPAEAPAGGFVRLDVRVPNEQEKAATVKVDVLLPPGFVEASYEPVPGWTTEVKTRKLAQPVQTDDGPVSEEVGEIVWTAQGKQSGIAPASSSTSRSRCRSPARPATRSPSRLCRPTRTARLALDRTAGLRRAGAARHRHGRGSSEQQATAPAAASSDDSSTTGWLALGFGIAGLAVGLAALGLVLAPRRRSA